MENEPGEGSVDYEARVGRRVRELREQRGWSQQELGRRLGHLGYPMHQATVAKLEAAQRPLRVNEVIALSRALSTPPEDFWGSPADDHPALVEARRDLRSRQDGIATIEDMIERLEDQIRGNTKSLEHARAQLPAMKLALAEAERGFEHLLDELEAGGPSQEASNG